MNLTVVIEKQSIRTEAGLHGTADLIVHANTEAWLRFLQRKMTGVFAILRRKIRLEGDPRLLIAFGNCFPF